MSINKDDMSTFNNVTLQLINKYLYAFKNNLTDESDTDMQKIIENIFESSKNESNFHIILLTILLSIFSIFGTISNLFVIIVFSCKFKNPKHTKFKQNNSDAITYGPGTTTLNFFKQNNKYSNYTNLRMFYSLIKYLAIIDFFTCSIAIPATIYEIWNEKQINEFFCKLFEQIRATGVLASNFLIMLIALERYLAIHKLKFNYLNFKPLSLRLVFILILSVVIGLFDMLQLSTYQIVNNNEKILIGICLPSEITLNFKLSRILRILITALFIFGSVFVLIIYIIIFKRTFELNKRRKIRRLKEDYMRRTLRTNSLQPANPSSSQNQNPDIPVSNDNIAIHTSTRNGTIKCVKKPSYVTASRNLRIAIMICLVTIIYYLAVIPWCLTINSLIEYNPFIYYTFLLNNTLNPLIYGFFNPYFRNCCVYAVKSTYYYLKSKCVSQSNK